MRILLADDHTIVRRHVRNLLQAQGWEVCAEATTGREAVAMTAKVFPDIVVLDLSMPVLNGLEAAQLIHEQFPEVDIIVLSMYEPYEVMGQWTGSGVRTYVLKTDLEDLVTAIHNLRKEVCRESENVVV